MIYTYNGLLLVVHYKYKDLLLQWSILILTVTEILTIMKEDG